MLPLDTYIDGLSLRRSHATTAVTAVTHGKATLSLLLMVKGLSDGAARVKMAGPGAICFSVCSVAAVVEHTAAARAPLQYNSSAISLRFCP